MQDQPRHDADGSHTAALRRTARLLTTLGLGMALGLGLGACAWVKVSDAGAAVAIRSAADVAACQQLGTASVQTTAKVLLERDPRKVETEVLALAKNQAGDMHANVIVPIGQIRDGAQSFTVYRCP